MGSFSKWTDNEIELLKTCNGLTYDEIVILIPNKKRQAISYKCKTLGVKVTKKNASWTKEEDRILINNAKGRTYSQLLELLPNRTKTAIKSRCESLKLNEAVLYGHENAWSEDETSILINNYSAIDVYGLMKLLPNRDKKSINTKAQQLNIKKSDSFMQSKKRMDKKSLQYIFKKYKEKLDTKSHTVLTNDKTIITFLFKYYLRKNNIDINRDYIIEKYVIGNILEDARLKTYVKKNFDNYFHFISLCFPLYKFKEWEFKNLDVSPNFWENERNRFECIETNLARLINNKVIENEIEVLSLPLDMLRVEFHSSMIYYFGKQVFNDYLKSKGFSYNEQDFKFLDGFSFDSFEEMHVYRHLKNMGLDIVKCSRKHRVYNDLHEEGYIPDFILQDSIYIEYYGLWKGEYKQGMFGYSDRVIRKNKFYKDNGYRFIAIYPDDLKDDCKTLEEKILKTII